MIGLSFRNLHSSQIAECVRKIWEAYLGSVDNTKELLAILKALVRASKVADLGFNRAGGNRGQGSGGEL